jgi:hypothetical protein
MITGRPEVMDMSTLWRPIDWYSKLQGTVEMATFGSEYIAMRTCTEKIIDHRTSLRYLGVPVKGAAMMFGDNESVVNTASIPHGKLHKRYNALAFHRTREAIAANITRYYHINGKKNPSDILSKHWDMPSVWDSLKPLLFWWWTNAEKPPRNESKKDTVATDSKTESTKTGSI